MRLIYSLAGNSGHKCKGICTRTKTNGKYLNGHNRYCSKCESYFTTEDLFCSCCGTSLRRKAR